MNKLTMRDANQIIQHTHDEQLNANRVVLVGNSIDVDSDKIANSVGNAISKLNFNYPQQTPIQIVEVPIIVKEQEIVYVDRVVVETKFIEIEKPIYLETQKIIEIEKQIVVKEQLIVKVPEFITKFEPIPLWMKVSFALFLGLSLIINLISVIKH